MPKLPLYFDYAATTPVDPVVAEKMMGCLTQDGLFGNPASRSHKYGWQAEEAVDVARHQVADLINADAREIVFTSGATESDNLAIKGAAQYYSDKGKHIITLKTEHKAVLDTCAQLEKEGFEVTYLDVGSDGLLDMDLFRSALREDTVLVSVMLVNNEVGVIQDIAAIGQLCRENGTLFHVDAAQASGKVSMDMAELPVDLMSLSAHKMYGPKGIGALYVRRTPRVRLLAQMHGGGHERGMRSGTLPTHQIVGMGVAAEIARNELELEPVRVKNLQQRLWKGVSQLEGVTLNGSDQQRVPHITNISFAGVDGELLLMALKDLALSSGSACTSASVEPSYVLRALGVEHELAMSSLRFSIGRYTSEDDIDSAVELIHRTIGTLRGAA
ncbi:MULTISPECIES: IscS subfamily cysteine desulfurase [Idiomarina]|uniref:Cysteine desulfurase IscS n=1 Tax=Idiomarina abyssalis TaxID=86102 RepID=A0A8I1GAC2_9GAMM|nr:MULTISPECIES: IscS subfamily cysteine desulfurase [Idiomarina]KPD21722.1 cysteine desulfurase [Idiomarina abyssalis]MBH93998.1 IscS subfamily cysteine desulfurase [Idiomarina sp.]MBJ7267631.1 IscS subfamily cysteine desulfurase [Idiomarina abyssalis]MBJ7272438.1 IscS subfamily cysteine desulfurase [Idiomarina abyssalis]MBJ7315322.1 IscS subfamily cysteine desulfurase [Idiomarina abyssalis]